MSAHLLLEAAVRSLVMGALIAVALRALRIEQVRARRTAWLLALAGALAMPALVGAQIGPRLLPSLAAPTQVAEPRQTIRRHVEQNFAMAAATPTETALPALVEAKRDPGTQLANSAISLIVMGYCIVATLLTLRLCAGLGFALRLLRQADRRIFSFDPRLDVRTSARISSPVTVASSVLLPSSYTSWDEPTLRIVLTHERAHVRQGDFYVHLLAGLHCALFWFNPFSWWLRRQLAELGEALSDRAAVEQAESRAGYAEILLAFAAGARWPLGGVAMANSSNLTPRIERLLNDRGFERSFAGKRRLPFIAAGVVMLAMVASTSMVKARTPPDGAPITPPSAPDAPSAPVAPTAPPITPPTAPIAPIAPTAPGVRTNTARSRTVIRSTIRTSDDSVDVHNDAGGANEEGILAIHSGKARITINSGESLPHQPGDYIYFQHNGKPYVVQDPELLAQARTLLEPMEELARRQKELDRQQALLAAQQRVLIAQQRAAKWVDTPEFKRQMAELQNMLKQMNLAELTAQANEKALAEVQAHLGEIQARVGQIQSEIGLQQGKFGEQEGALGEQQGKLGEQQGQLAEQQQKIVEQVRRQLKPIIEQAISEGKGTLLVK
jgi:beta-lactamase regulating signal transducer with metallopeptidase domain